jgi:mRNA-degrading endonuclease RelE of RelBE toxin-antitoxin system
VKKEIFYDNNGLKELRALQEKVQEEFEAYIRTLRQEGKLDFPEAKYE